MVEFALGLPLLLGLLAFLLEVANYILVRERVSQLALQVVDNATRIGTQNSIQSVIDEGQVNDLLTGAQLQGGNLNISENGRIVLSSLEVDPASPHGQFIHWQRCFGSKSYSSAYGPQGTGKGNVNLKGMGSGGSLVKATTATPVMFVEISYSYRPLISSFWVPTSDIVEVAAMQVRDNRDTSGNGINPLEGVTALTC